MSKPAAQVAPPPRSNNLALWILIVLIVIAMGGAGAWWFVQNRAPAASATPAAASVKPARYYALEPAFVVNLADEDSVRYLQADVQVMTRDEATGVMHVHFNGAGGNIGAGKWNDGAHENRQILADRVAAAMAAAWENTKRVPVSADDLGWESIAVALPPAPHLEEEELQQVFSNKEADLLARSTAAGQLAWLRRCAAGEKVDVACLRLGTLRVLHMPGELFVEYQLAAQAMRKDLHVAMAAYGDYGPGYIGTTVAYGEGGYETSPRASSVAPDVEPVLMEGMKKLLQAN